MGQPGRGNARSSRAEFIGAAKRTRGSETSQYPLEEKSIEIPSVAASERGTAQTRGSDTPGVVGLPLGQPRKSTNRRRAEGVWKGQPQRVIVPYANSTVFRGSSRVLRDTCNPVGIWGDHPPRLNTHSRPIVN